MNKKLSHIDMTRNAKFWAIHFTEEFIEDYQKTLRIMNGILSDFRSKLISGEIVKIDRFNIYMRDSKVYSAATYNKEVIPHLYDVEDKWSLKRQLLFYCMERYTGYKRRNNDKKIPTITIKEGKSFYYKESCFITLDTTDKSLTVQTLYRTHKLKYDFSLKSENVTPKAWSNKLTIGGNFNIKQKSFVAAVDIQKEIAYDIENILAFDINKTKEDWLVFNDGYKISQPEEISSIISKIKELNKNLDQDKKKTVNERLFRSKDRRKMRHQWIKEHQKLKSIIVRICTKICNRAIETKSLLCIDSVKTGQTNGTFGQDHIIPTLQTMCENQGIPFYVVPCKNTSRRCSLCGHIEAENRIDAKTFHCKACGYKCDAQQNGADNIAYQGKRLLDAGVPFGNKAKRSVDKLISEYT